MENNKTIEILKTAILMEKRGYAFYSQVAEQTKVEEVKKIFAIMAEEEVAHIKYLTDQFSEYTKNAAFHKFNLPKDTQDSIAKAILSKDIKKKLSAASYEAAAIAAAIDMENRAIQVYSERAKSATDTNEKALYQMLSDWERTHHKILYELDQQLKEDIWADNSFWPF
jgi:rubrerythrin